MGMTNGFGHFAVSCSSEIFKMQSAELFYSLFCVEGLEIPDIKFENLQNKNGYKKITIFMRMISYRFIIFY